MFVHKIDEDLALKLTDIRDAGRIFELTNQSREYLREWLPWLDTTTRPEHTESFIKMCLRGYTENNCIHTAIIYRDVIVGVAGYNTINWANKTAYIGYWLGHEYQGKGIMTRVAQALTEYAFQTLKLNKVEIHAAVENKKSRSIPERLGFVEEGCIRQCEWLYDHYVDHVVYGMLADEWNKGSTQ